MKKFIKSILTLGVVLGVFMVMGESDDMTAQVIWTISWAVETAVCGIALVKLFPEEFKEDRA